MGGEPGFESFRTAKGVGIDDTVGDLRAAYGSALTEESETSFTTADGITVGADPTAASGDNMLLNRFEAGLTCPITNPLVPEINTAVLAADLSLGRDEYGMRWIKAYRKRLKNPG